MSTAQIRKQLVERIDIADERLLKMIYAMTEAYYDETINEQGYDISGKPSSASTLRTELEKEFIAAKNGEYINLDTLKQKSKQWLNNTK